MKLEGNILGEISHKDPQILHLTIYMWNLKKEKKIKLLETENRIVVARDWEVGKQGKVGKTVQTVIRQNFGEEWAKWVKRVERHKLSVLR